MATQEAPFAFDFNRDGVIDGDEIFSTGMLMGFGGAIAGALFVGIMRAINR